MTIVSPSLSYTHIVHCTHLTVSFSRSLKRYPIPMGIIGTRFMAVTKSHLVANTMQANTRWAPCMVEAHGRSVGRGRLAWWKGRRGVMKGGLDGNQCRRFALNAIPSNNTLHAPFVSVDLLQLEVWQNIHPTLSVCLGGPQRVLQHEFW